MISEHKFDLVEVAGIAVVACSILVAVYLWYSQPPASLLWPMSKIDQPRIADRIIVAHGLRIIKRGICLVAQGRQYVRCNEPPAEIRADHSHRLITLGYMAHLQGRLRMTTLGRARIAAGFNASGPE
jgi:hypothetical protein